MDEKNTPLASEMYEDLKQHTEFLRKTVCRLMIVICILIAALAATNIYHTWQWSQFDTVVVDTSGGNGNANYVQGDNTGGIYNGESGSPQEEGRESEGNPDQAQGG